MGALFGYSLFGGVFLAVGWLAYRIFLASRKYGTMNRISLLGLYGAALLAMPLSGLIQNFLPAAGEGAMVGFGGLTALPLGEESISSRELIMVALLWVYVAGVAAMMVYMTIGLIRVKMLIARGKSEKFGVCRLVRLNGFQSPFSFGHTIVVGSDEVDLPIVIAHEISHISQRHWLDLLLAQGVCALMWYNPAAWLMRRELRDVHEFIADESVIAQGIDPVSYQKILLKKAIGTRLQPFTNSLNQSNIYKRITMMYKKNPSGLSRLRVLGMVPALLAAAAICGASPVAETISLATVTSLNNASRSEAKVTQISENAQQPDGITMPQFPGGESELINFLNNNVVYPQEAMTAGEQGMVCVMFKVEADGSISEISVDKSVSPTLDKEAVRVVKAMPSWIPGRNENGRPVACVYNLPVRFRLNNGSIASTPVRESTSIISADNSDLTFPKFPGGEAEMVKYLSQNISYPEEAMKAGEQGKVSVMFKVETDGSISEVSVVKSVSASLDKEAVRVVKTMPRWTPGTNKNGEPIAVEYHIPVMFKLDRGK